MEIKPIKTPLEIRKQRLNACQDALDIKEISSQEHLEDLYLANAELKSGAISDARKLNIAEKTDFYSQFNDKFVAQYRELANRYKQTVVRFFGEK